jgi:hypothetical protein
MKLFYGLLLISSVCWADNIVTVDQIGNSNTITVTQDGDGHNTYIKLGATSDVDYTTVSVLQQGTAKTAKVEIPSGINNTASIQQEGTGNHYASIMNLNGSGNNISIGQSGAGNHVFNVIGDTGTTNNGNTVSAQQSGNAGADKLFNLTLSGASGASVNVQQTNQTTANTGSMTLQCNPCGAYSYIRQ